MRQEQINMMQYIRGSRWAKIVSAFLSIGFIHTMVYPTTALAITGGATQPEFTSFSPVSSNEMVNLFTGDFSYNLPLFTLPSPNGGYPFNLSYNGGIGMEQEASWTGLGWNVNAGAINRSVRGLPDDFKGDGTANSDYLTIKSSMLDNHTYGLNLSGALEIFGKDPLDPKGGLGLSMYYNNYRGLGYSVSPGFSMGLDLNKGGIKGQVGLSMDSQSGAGVNADLSYVQTNKSGYNMTGFYKDETQIKQYGIGIGLNSAQGMSFSSSFSVENHQAEGIVTKSLFNRKIQTSSSGTDGGASSYFSLAAPSSLPSLSLGTSTVGLNVLLATGAEVGVFTKIGFGGFYNNTHIKDEYRNKKYHPLGYNYLQVAHSNPISKDQVLDYSRYNEGMLTSNSSNLPSAQMDYDIYMVTGQGLGGMFRAHRNSYSHLHKTSVNSNSNSGSFGIDIGSGALLKGGFNAKYTYGNSETGKWSSGNDMNGRFTSASDNAVPDYENYYFKFQGESTTYATDELDAIGQEYPLSPELSSVSLDDSKVRGTTYKTKFGSLFPINDFYKREARKERTNHIQHYVNSDLIDYVSSTNYMDHIPAEYQVEYYDEESGLNTNIIKTKRDSLHVYKRNHIGGFTVLKQDGSRYVYGIPVYNRTKVEASFSNGINTSMDHCDFLTKGINTNDGVVDFEQSGTKQLNTRKETSPYATSYLITSVLGADYVDVDGNGLSDNDLGYWVKFNYVKKKSNYQWRVPYVNANYERGFENDINLGDDMGSYQYGEKEIYYLASAETSSHKAIFNISERKDGYGAAGELAQFPSLNAYSTAIPRDLQSKSYKLDNIELYAKQAGGGLSTSPIQTTHFTYDYSLCPGTYNNVGTAEVVNGVNINQNKGKLTLKSVSTTYGSNLRGKQTPYQFSYGTTNNYSYSPSQMDRWGNYQSDVINALSGNCNTKYHPYTHQFDPDVPQSDAAHAAFKEIKDREASAWHLTGIDLPSGGAIDITYEADDYGYVQHRKATQMFKVMGVGTAIGQNNVVGKSNKKLFFRLEHPIDASNLTTAKTQFAKQYLEHLKRDKTFQVFFKTRILLRDAYWQSISGWANLNPQSFGFDTSSIVGGNYTIAWIELEGANADVNGEDLHPFQYTGMAHLRMNQPEMVTASKAPSTAAANSDWDKVARIQGLSTLYNPLMQMFSGYYNYLQRRNFCEKIDLNYTFIRLCTPDGKKYGGGVRVKSVEVTDNWGQVTGDTTQTATYGQYYDYTMEDEATGEIISSGVAANEPMIGGEENALKYVKFYGQKIKPAFWGANNLFFEYPINAAYYPSASVGYRKVTVMSTNTKDQLQAGGAIHSTSGVTEHEFYTAKEFPVIADETPIATKAFNMDVPVPLVGSTNIHKRAFGQGYSILLNDMHGKPKSVTSYGLGSLAATKKNLMTKTTYNYQKKKAFIDEAIAINRLNNKVATLDSDMNWSTGQVESEERIIGEDYELFMESNENRSESTMGGLDFDTDGLLIGILPIFTLAPWPAYSRSVQQQNFATINKVIYQTGVLESVESQDEGAKTIVKNEYYDKLTGEPLIVSTTNKYNGNSNQSGTTAPLTTYQYSVPARWNYDGMGAAYNHQGFTFRGIPNSQNGSGVFTLSGIGTQLAQPLNSTYLLNKLTEGDELIFTNSAGGKAKVTLIVKGDTPYSVQFHSSASIVSGAVYRCQIIRSGKRNLLAAKSGSSVSFEHPIDRTLSTAQSVNYQKNELLADFLNAHLNCDGELKEGQYDLTIDRFDDETGAVIHPEFSLVYQEATVASSSNNYTVDLTRHDGTSESYTIGSSQTAISHFTASGTNLMVHYYTNGTTFTLSIGATNTYTANVQYQLQNDVLSASAIVYRDHWPVVATTNCLTCQSGTAYHKYQDTNPYQTGEKGIYRPAVNYYYDSYRKQTSDAQGVAVALKDDGVFFDEDGTTGNRTFYPFPHQSTSATDNPIHPNWETGSSITRYNKRGFQVESHDALGIPSSAKYGYQGMLPVIAGQNMNYCELFSLTAEDADETTTMVDYSSALNVVNQHAHTGKHAFQMRSSESRLSLSYPVKEGQTYVFSAWGRYDFESALDTQLIDYTAPNNPQWAAGEYVGVDIEYKTSSGVLLSTTHTALPSGNKIEQWQRIEESFTAPYGAATMELRFRLPSSIAYNQFLWDDLRLYPLGSLVTTNVYDPETYRLIATLDENNYAVEYTYDASGNLYSTRIETPKGRMNINESRAHSPAQ